MINPNPVTLRREIYYFFTATLFAIILTWPALKNFSNTYVGLGSEDSGLYSGYMRALNIDGTNPFSTKKLTAVGWPDGVRNSAEVNLITPLSTLVNWILTKIVGSLEAQIIGVWLPVIIACVFVLKITASFTHLKVPQIFAMTVVSLIPMNLQWSSALPLMNTSWLFLGLIYFFIFESKNQFMRTSMFSIFYVMALFWHPYTAIFSSFLVFSLLLSDYFLYKRLNREILVSTTLSFLVYFCYSLYLNSFHSIPVAWVGEGIAQPSRQNLFQYSFMDFSSRSFINPILVIIFILCLYLCSKGTIVDMQFRRLILSGTIAIGVLLLSFGPFSFFSFPLPAYWLNTLIPGLRNGQYGILLIQNIVYLVSVIAIIIFLLSWLRKSRIESLASTFLLILLVPVVLFVRLPSLDGNIDRWMVQPEGVNFRETRSIVSGLSEGPVLIAPFEVIMGTDGIVCNLLSDRQHPLVNTCGIGYQNRSKSLIDRIYSINGDCEKIRRAQENGVRHLLLLNPRHNPKIITCLQSLENLKVAELIETPENLDMSIWRIN